jgi:Domain of unknown function (DUF4124)
MHPSPFGIVSMALALHVVVSSEATAQTVYRWTDESGRTHYSSTVPAERRGHAKAIDTTSARVSESDRQAAIARLVKDQATLRKAALPAAASSPASTPSGRNGVAAAPRAEEQLTCQEAWKRYNESYACFDPYRIANGAVRPEGFAQCKEVLRPDPCR